MGMLPGFSQSEGNRINDRGQICGDVFQSDVAVPPAHAFLYSQGVMKDLGTLGGQFSSGRDINNLGDVVGVSELTDNKTYHPFLYHDGGMTDLRNTVLTSDAVGAADSINDRGDIAGAGFIYVGGIMSLFNIDGWSINSQGEVVTQIYSGGGSAHAALYNAGTFTDLGLPAPNGQEDTVGTATPWCINDSGDVVGQGSTFTDTHALLYQSGKMMDLNTLIDPGAGWILQSAHGINASGQIVGYGLHGGQTHAFLLTPIS